MSMFTTKTLSITSLSLAFVVCVGTAAFAAPPPHHGGGHGGSAVAKEVAEAVNALKPDFMKLETLPKTGYAESEAAAYGKKDAWVWLFR